MVISSISVKQTDPLPSFCQLPSYCIFSFILHCLRYTPACPQPAMAAFSKITSRISAKLEYIWAEPRQGQQSLLSRTVLQKLSNSHRCPASLVRDCLTGLQNKQLFYLLLPPFPPISTVQHKHCNINRY